MFKKILWSCRILTARVFVVNGWVIFLSFRMLLSVQNHFSVSLFKPVFQAMYVDVRLPIIAALRPQTFIPSLSIVKHGSTTEDNEV